MIVPAFRKFLTSGSEKKPVLVVLAGPNGAGKTTSTAGSPGRSTTFSRQFIS